MVNTYLPLHLEFFHYRVDYLIHYCRQRRHDDLEQLFTSTGRYHFSLLMINDNVAATLGDMLRTLFVCYGCNIELKKKN